MRWVAASLATSGVLIALSVFSTPHRWWVAQEEAAPRKLAETLDYDTLPKEALSTFSNYPADESVEARPRSLTGEGSGVSKKDALQSWTLAMVSGTTYGKQDGSFLVTAHADNFLRIWDLSNLQAKSFLVGKIDASPLSNYGVNGLFAMDADFVHKKVVVGANDGSVFIYELEDHGVLIRTLKRGTYSPGKWRWGYPKVNERFMLQNGVDAGHVEPVTAIKMNWDGNRVLTAGDTIKLWDLTPNPPTVIRTLHCLAGYDCKVHKGAFPTGTVEATGDHADWAHSSITCMEVDWASGKVVTGHQSGYIGSKRFQSLKVWDMNTGEQTTEMGYTAGTKLKKKGSTKSVTTMYEVYHDIKSIQVDFSRSPPWVLSSRSRYAVLPLKENGQYKALTSGPIMGVGTRVYAYGPDDDGSVTWYTRYDKEAAMEEGAAWISSSRSGKNYRAPMGSESGAEIYAMCVDFSDKTQCRNGVVYTGDYNGLISKFCSTSGSYSAQKIHKLEDGEKIRSCAILKNKHIAFGTFMHFDDKNEKGGSLRVFDSNLIEQVANGWNRRFTKSDDKVGDPH